MAAYVGNTVGYGDMAWCSTRVGAAMSGTVAMGSSISRTGNYPFPSGGTAVTYRMRGKIGTAFVFWNATIIDSTGAQYTGGGGPPTDIVLIS